MFQENGDWWVAVTEANFLFSKQNFDLLPDSKVVCQYEPLQWEFHYLVHDIFSVLSRNRTYVLNMKSSFIDQLVWPLNFQAGGRHGTLSSEESGVISCLNM